MSEETPQPEISKYSLEEPTPEQKLEWLIAWRTKVQGEIDDYNGEKDKLYAVYKKQKEMYDSWLSGRMKKIKKYDNLVMGRKKVLIDINKEIETRSAAIAPVSQ